MRDQYFYKQSYAVELNSIMKSIVNIQADIAANAKTATTDNVLIVLDGLIREIEKLKNAYDSVSK